MYAAEDGEIYAKFYINYRLSEEFTMILPLLLDEGMKPLVYTRDPNVNDSLFRSMTAGTDSIRTLKKQNLPENERRLYQRISLGMVSVGDKTNIINALLLTKKYASLSAKLAMAELPAMIGGALIGLFLAICVPAKISSLLLALWHAAWCAALFFIGKKTFSKRHVNGTVKLFLGCRGYYGISIKGLSLNLVIYRKTNSKYNCNNQKYF